MRILAAALLLISSVVVGVSQQPNNNTSEKRVGLTETAVAYDANGASVMEATLQTTALNGTDEAPIPNIQLVVRNTSQVTYAFASGVVTFYDNQGVRCGQGIFKADALAVGEAIETDTPGVRIRCAPATWRLVATNLVPRIAPNPNVVMPQARALANLTISIDGESHPIQLNKPLKLNFGERTRTIIVSELP